METRLQAINAKSEAHKILRSNFEGSAKFVEECKQAKKMRPVGEQMFLPTYQSIVLELSSSSSSKKSNSFLSRVPELVMREFETSHYTSKVKPS